MSNIIHMEIEQARNLVSQLNQKLSAIETSLQQVYPEAESLDWAGISRDEFIIEFSNMIRSLSQHLEQGRTLTLRLQHEVDEWEQVDSGGAARLAALVLSSVSMASMGQVLGAHTDNVILASNMSQNFTTEYQKMPWSTKFQEAESLRQQIAEYEAKLQNERGIDLINQELSDIDAQLKDLQDKRDEAQKNADNILQKLIPDWPLEGNDDGWGLRSKADDYEDEVAQYNQQIDALSQRKDAVLQEQNRVQMDLQQLNILQDKQSSLRQVIDQGIPKDGPSEKYPYFPGDTNTNCTKYASQMRNVPTSGHAYLWDDQASNNGYEVGTQPVKGSIMVWEPGVHGANPDFGHVSYVERVEYSSDGTAKVYYTDNSNHDSQNPWTLTIAPGEKGVNFIYDQKKE